MLASPGWEGEADEGAPFPAARRRKARSSAREPIGRGRLRCAVLGVVHLGAFLVGGLVRMKSGWEAQRRASCGRPRPWGRGDTRGARTAPAGRRTAGQGGRRTAVEGGRTPRSPARAKPAVPFHSIPLPLVPESRRFPNRPLPAQAPRLNSAPTLLTSLVSEGTIADFEVVVYKSSSGFYEIALRLHSVREGGVLATVRVRRRAMHQPDDSRPQSLRWRDREASGRDRVGAGKGRPPGA